jgi:hypothetical protein
MLRHGSLEDGVGRTGSEGGRKMSKHNDGQPATVLFIGGPKDGDRETVPVVHSHYTAQTAPDHLFPGMPQLHIYSIRQYSSPKGTIWVYLYAGTDETRLMEILLLGYREPKS